MPGPPVLRPTPLEIASGVVLGRVTTTSTLQPATCNPLTALDRAVLPTLTHPPCLVSFSGGIDSSFVLAVATRVARREGLALPIPVTWRFTDAPRAGESPWQERVIAALAIKDWSILHAGDELDLIGPVAQRLLARHGVLHPANMHLHLPIVEMASSGSLLTGWGGDQVLAGWRRQRRPARTNAVHTMAPAGLVALVRQHRDDPFPWLRPDVSRRLIRGNRREVRTEPTRIDRRIEWHSQRRDLLLASSGLADVAADNNVQLVHPLLDPGFLAATRRLTHGARGLTRSQLLHEISDGELHQTATSPRLKARFREVFFRERTREFTRSWDGTGTDASLVNAEALRELWTRWPIPAETAGLVQQLWLSAAPRPYPTTTK